jgi:hypothetical protein
MQRIQEILPMILDGAEHHDLFRYVSAKGWGITARMLYHYISDTYRIIDKRVEKERNRLISRHVLQRRRIYADSIKIGDYKTALAAAIDEARITGLYPEKATQQINNTQIIVVEDPGWYGNQAHQLQAERITVEATPALPAPTTNGNGKHP